MKFANRYPMTNFNFGLFNDCFPPVVDGVSMTVRNYAHWLNKESTAYVVTPSAWIPHESVADTLREYDFKGQLHTEEVKDHYIHLIKRKCA
jgi:hypothetical protein